MTLDGSHRFNAPRDRVWAAFNDPAVLARATPGCQRLEPLGTDEFEATLSVGVAAVKGVYQGRLAITDKNPPEGYTLRVEGSGRPGFVKGEAQIMLSVNGNQTVVAIGADAEAGGMIARVGQRLIESVARMSMDRFFGCLATKL